MNNIPNREQLEQCLAEEYFDRLENECVDFLESDGAGGLNLVKAEYQVTPDEQADYLGYRNFEIYMFEYLRDNHGVSQVGWIRDWSREVI